jgi:hypothetical protein
VFAENDDSRWRVRMMPQLRKYVAIPWLDRIVVSMQTFRTAYLEESLTQNGLDR